MHIHIRGVDLCIVFDCIFKISYVSKNQKQSVSNAF